MRHRLCFRVLPAIAVLSLSTGCFCCEGLAYREDLSAGYAVWAVDLIEWASIVKRTDGSLGEQVVGPMVYAYGWNQHYIIAKQHPLLNLQSIDSNTTMWYIIDVQSDTVHGPLTEQQYEDLRSTIGVPEELAFTRTIEP